jgi:galactokinase
VELLRHVLPDVRALRDVSLSQFEEHGEKLADPIRKRCRHVVTENARVQAAAEALRAGDLGAMGDLMRASHASMRDDYEISTREVDTMVESAMHANGTIGARMTGGGFGGCTVNLVRVDEAASFAESVAASYQAATGLTPEIYTCVASDGVGRYDA